MERGHHKEVLQVNILLLSTIKKYSGSSTVKKLHLWAPTTTPIWPIFKFVASKPRFPIKWDLRNHIFRNKCTGIRLSGEGIWAKKDFCSIFPLFYFP